MNEENKIERKKFAKRVFFLITAFLLLVFLVLFLCGFRLATRFVLSDTVLITLLGSTTATVISLFAFVMKYLFK